jgi:cellulose biosynthesis protein BcsQ
MIVTFYSYKGGVGRTSALANIACLLAQDEEHPQRVLLWDFDLEAPGIHKLFPPKERHNTGFIDLVHDYTCSGKINDIKEFIYESEINNLDVLPAGPVGPRYAERLQAINWPGFFSEDPANPSEFFSNLLTELEKLNYDYILVDSRTGLNDHAGICTQILPQLIVVLFRLNDQDLEGLQHVIPSLKQQLKLRGKDEVGLLPVASAVVPSGAEDFKRRRELFLEVFGAKELDYVRFDTDLLNNQRLYFAKQNRTGIWPAPSVMRDYEHICTSIRRQNRSDTQTQTTEIATTMQSGDYASVGAILMPLIRRRPRLESLWNTLNTLTVVGAIPKERIDAEVEQILSADSKNSFACEWQARRLIGDAQTPQSDKVGFARRIMEGIFEGETTQSSVHWMLARICSIQGDLQGATTVLKKGLEQFGRNSQILIDLASFRIRMGAEYFQVALENLTNVRQDIPMKVAMKAILSSFFGNQTEWEMALEQYKSKLNSEQEYGGIERYKVLRAHVLLNCGKEQESLALAHESLKGSLNDQDKENWIELLICATQFELAREVLQTIVDEGQRATREALSVLIDYLTEDPTRDATRDKLLTAWSAMDSWGFTELLVLRERAKRDKSTLASKLDVLESVIRYAELSKLRRAFSGGPSGPTLQIVFETGNPHRVTKRFR